MNFTEESLIYDWNGFQAEKEGQKVEHHICVSHLPRLANPGTSQQMEDHQADIKVPVPYGLVFLISLKQALAGGKGQML
jgi:hypothetical protein